MSALASPVEFRMGAFRKTLAMHKDQQPELARLGMIQFAAIPHPLALSWLQDKWGSGSVGKLS
jgi:hypothetical protein